MNFSKEEQPLGGGEGSVIYYFFEIGNVSIHLATSRNIKFSDVKRSWVKELDFLYDFNSFEELKEIITDSNDFRIAKYIRKELE